MAEVWFRVLGSDGELVDECSRLDDALKAKRAAGPGARIENFRRAGTLATSHDDQQAQVEKRHHKFMGRRS